MPFLPLQRGGHYPELKIDIAVPGYCPGAAYPSSRKVMM